jgi:hypothetical protein
MVGAKGVCEQPDSSPKALPRALKEPLRWCFTAERRRCEDRLDERKALSGGGGLFGYHPELGGYPDLYNHLLGVGLSDAKRKTHRRLS